MKEGVGRLLRDFFDDDDVATLSAAMSFYQILALVPVLFVLVSLVSIFPWLQQPYQEFQGFLNHHLLPESQQELSSYIQTFLANSTQLGWMGGLSLIVAALLFFVNFDIAIARIAQSPKQPLWKATATHSLLILMMPFVLTLWLFLSHLFPTPFLPSWLQIPIPYAWPVIATLFFLAYRFLPSRTIPTRIALYSALVASTIFEGAKIGFVFYARYATSYLLYGPFAVLLLFFVWLYLSWMIFFYGLKLCRILSIPISETQKNQRQSS